MEKSIRLYLKKVPKTSTVCGQEFVRSQYIIYKDQYLPPDLWEYIGLVTLHENFQANDLARRPGYYVADQASGTLDLRGEEYRLKIQGPTLESVLALYRKIRGGSIAPCEPWDQPQVGFEDQLRKVLIEELGKRDFATKAALDRLRKHVDDSFWRLKPKHGGGG